MSTYRFARIDAFTDRPFAGNPAAVVWVHAWPADETMAAIAAENNLSETAGASAMARAHQRSARGGRLVCEVRGDRVRLTGRCVRVIEGTLYA